MTDTARIDAMALADVLARHRDGTDPGIVARMPDLGWYLAADLAHIFAPTVRVRRMTLAIIRDRATNPDPFAGFPRPVDVLAAEAVDDAIDAATETRHERQATKS